MLTIPISPRLTPDFAWVSLLLPTRGFQLEEYLTIHMGLIPTTNILPLPLKMQNEQATGVGFGG